MAITLYGSSKSGNCLKPKWVAQRLGVPFEWIETDSFDGSIGRFRDTGLAKWGFYMDHFLDYIFMSSVFVGYALLMSEPRGVYLTLALGFVYASVMAHSFLDFGATGQFKITYLFTGPTEVRLYFILINTFVILKGPGWLEAALPWALVVFALALAAIVYAAQKRIWALDMEAKAARAAKADCGE